LYEFSDNIAVSAKKNKASVTERPIP